MITEATRFPWSFANAAVIADRLIKVFMRNEYKPGTKRTNKRECLTVHIYMCYVFYFSRREQGNTFRAAFTWCRWHAVPLVGKGIFLVFR